MKKFAYKSNENMNYQLIIQFQLADASVDDFDRLIIIENELRIIMKDKHDVDGHDLGADEMNIFIHTNDPDDAFKLAKNVLSKNDLKTILVASRQMKGEEYSVIWPENFSGEFKIKQA
jgi:hypothetical protein